MGNHDNFVDLGMDFSGSSPSVLLPLLIANIHQYAYMILTSPSIIVSYLWYSNQYICY